MRSADVDTDDGIREQATVFVPDGKLGYFLKRLDEYAGTASTAKPENRNLVDRIASIGLASLEQLWTDPPSEFPEPRDARVVGGVAAPTRRPGGERGSSDSPSRSERGSAADARRSRTVSSS